MAYLKGGTYVDGTLYVRDALLVKNINSNDGVNFPYVDDNANESGEFPGYTNHLAMFSNDISGLKKVGMSVAYSTVPSGEDSIDRNFINLEMDDYRILQIVPPNISLDSNGISWELTN